MMISIKNKNLSARRGISNIVGTLIMVAIVAAFGSVIMFQGLNGINDFNYYLSFLTGSKNSVNESAVIEHVRFNPTTNAMDVWVRNTGTTQLEISKVSIVKMNTQDKIIASNPRATIPINQLVNINQIPTKVNEIPTVIVWNTAQYCGLTFPTCTVSYRISITTASGNSFETTATPFNT